MTCPRSQPGTILGHEAVGTVVGAWATPSRRVERRRPRARVLHHLLRPLRAVPGGRYGLCTGGGGWILGHLIDGVQAEYARIPFADTSVYKVPPTP